MGLIDYNRLDTMLLIKAVNQSEKLREQLLANQEYLQGILKTTMAKSGESLNLQTSESMALRIDELRKSNKKLKSLADLFLLVKANFEEVSTGA
ncbi:MAG TPA: hypothetical protein VJG49_02080 [Candidatus Nanoarchaeia archaeon]|nr:hypothetical protein [Candidatus Nanoarchaeia archaeon]